MKTPKGTPGIEMIEIGTIGAVVSRHKGIVTYLEVQALSPSDQSGDMTAIEQIDNSDDAVHHVDVVDHGAETQMSDP